MAYCYARTDGDAAADRNDGHVSSDNRVNDCSAASDYPAAEPDTDTQG